MTTANLHVLSFAAPNIPGVVAAVTGAIAEHGCDILDSQHHDDLITRRSFMRILFRDEHAIGSRRLEAALAGIAERFRMDWRLRTCSEKRRVMLLASRFDHCLADLIYRWRTGELPMEVTAVVSNHPIETFRHLTLDDVPFHHLPGGAEAKARNEATLLRLIEDTQTELVVLARYMQILSNDLASQLSGRCINIHHSFLPGFKGAKAYHQAFERGVKLIGATAHYVTSDLDEGPIIEQDVERISHRDTPDDLIRKGRDIERRVLARAVLYHLEDRVLLNGGKTIVFAG
jgi:formyltetrahydrofolate deformylase